MATLSGRTWTIKPRSDGKLYMSDIRKVYPIDPGGIFENDPYTITNTDADWQVTDESLLDGTLEVFDGGRFQYTRGVQTGTAWFDYTVFDYDGAGNDYTLTVTIDVQ